MVEAVGFEPTDPVLCRSWVREPAAPVRNRTPLGIAPGGVSHSGGSGLRFELPAIFVGGLYGDQAARAAVIEPWAAAFLPLVVETGAANLLALAVLVD